MTAAPQIPAACDVVVIGAGIGGLTSAAALAKAGLRVCVLEADLRPGGYLAGFQRKKFVFDTAIHWLNQCGENGMTRRIFDYLGPGAPATPPLRDIRRYLSDSADYRLTDEPLRMRDALVADFPEDRDGIHRFFATAEKVGGFFTRICQSTRTPLSMTLREKGRFMIPNGIAGLSMVRHDGPAEKMLRKYFRSQGMRNLFAAENNFLSCLVPVGWAFEGDYQKPPEGGSRAFPRWLCRLLDCFGATVSFRSRARRILLDGKKVSGVQFQRREKGADVEHTIRCRHVVAAGDLLTVYRDLLPPGVIRPSIIRRIENADLYDSSVSMYLGLDVPPGELGFGDEMVTLTKDGVARADHSGPDPHKVALSILAPSHRDPTLAPPGKGTLVIYAPARMEHGDRWQTGPDLERGAAYEEYKQAYGDGLLDRVAAAIAPDLRRHIEVAEIATPVTHQRYTLNHNGSIMAARPSRRNILGRVASYLTPVENLIVGGHWAEYGGGVPVAVRAGFNSALLILQQERPAVFDVVKQLMDGVLDPGEVRSPELLEAVFDS